MSLIVHLLLCLSLHACSARRLGVTHKETVQGLELPDKSVEPSSIVERLRVQEQNSRIGFDRRMILPSLDGASKMMQQKNSESEALGKEHEDNKGNYIILPSAEQLLHETADVKDQKRQERSLMASSSDNAEETVESKENDMGKDIVVMDYAQPHRKPPIHNRGEP